MLEENIPIIISGDNRWDQLASHYDALKPWALSLLKAGLENFAQTIVVEPKYICKDHRNLHSHFYSKKFSERSAVCARLHFFSTKNISQSALLYDPDSLSKDYIGYSVIRPVTKMCIGRTVLDPWRLGRDITHGFYSLRTPFKTHVFGPTFTACGYPYMSQDTEAMVCAHTALWGVCRYLSERYTAYQELYPYDLVRMTGDSQGRRLPYRAMRYSDYSTILTHFGCHPEIIQTKESQDDPALDQSQYRKLCTYVESGFPVLASFSRHVVSVIGHTLDKTRKPTPNHEQLIFSNKFLKQLIVVDDNFFPYQLLGEASDPANYGQKYKNPYSIDGICVGVCPLPEKVYLPAAKAEEQFLTALRRFRKDPTYSKAIFAGKDEPLVLRPLLTTNTAFRKRRLEKAVLGKDLKDPLAAKIATLHLPHFIWLMEISPLSLYTEGKCTAEIVLDATANQNEKFLLYARLGQNLLLQSTSVTIKDGGGMLDTFEQYTHNLGEL